LPCLALHGARRYLLTHPRSRDRGCHIFCASGASPWNRTPSGAAEVSRLVVHRSTPSRTPSPPRGGERKAEAPPIATFLRGMGRAAPSHLTSSPEPFSCIFVHTQPVLRRVFHVQSCFQIQYRFLPCASRSVLVQYGPIRSCPSGTRSIEITTGRPRSWAHRSSAPGPPIDVADVVLILFGTVKKGADQTDRESTPSNAQSGAVWTPTSAERVLGRVFPGALATKKMGWGRDE
jgi:hypothetical protein